MKEYFSDLLSMKGVRGVVLFGQDGSIGFEAFTGAGEPEAKNFANWGAVANALSGVRESDLIFESGRFYIRRTELGILMVVMELTVSVAMVKLNCDILLPNLKQAGAKGFKRFFRK